MDPYVNLFGRKSTLVKLDCKSETHVYIPFDADSIRFVLFNTGVRHNFIKLSEAFDERRMQCKAGLDIIQKLYPEISILSQATKTLLDSALRSYDEKVYKRCLYVFEESRRVEAVCSALEAGDFNSVGRHLLDGHEGLRNLYEVSCDETDFLVDQVKGLDGVLGARMMGAGFGGCTLNLIKTEAVEEVIAAIRPLYKERFGNHLKVYHTLISDGTSELEIT